MLLVILRKLLLVLGPTILMYVWEKVVVRKLNKESKASTIDKKKVVEGKIV